MCAEGVAFNAEWGYGVGDVPYSYAIDGVRYVDAYSVMLLRRFDWLIVVRVSGSVVGIVTNTAFNSLYRMSVHGSLVCSLSTNRM